VTRVFTAKEVSSLSAVPLRQIQTWTNAGILLAIEGSEKPGRGGSRQYDQTEVDLALLLGAIAFHGISVREVASIAKYLRGMRFERMKLQKKQILLLFKDAAGIWHHRFIPERRSQSAVDWRVDTQWRGGYSINLTGLFHAAKI
jgi:DNA-binding transcriptional MerR regulator